MATEQRKAFKDWFDKAAAKSLVAQIESAYPAFDGQRFERLACKNLKALEFNARVQQFSSAMAQTLPAEYPAAVAILCQSLPPAQVDCESITDGWLHWPMGQFIADYGVDHFEESMTAMIELTQRFSAEFAVRPFVERYPKETLERLLQLTSHVNPHVRRWCSEGTRTRLPWGRKLHQLIDDPAPIWPILEALKDDSELYVRRSVGNSINDLTKDHSKQVIDRCTSWQKRSNANRDWVIRHGLRSLIKEGDRSALALFGYSSPIKLDAKVAIDPGRINVGETLTVSVELSNGAALDQELLVDYIVHYVRKNGSSNAKVFKWKTLSLAAGSTIDIKKNVPMRETTIRALYSGEHRIDVQVNGEVFAGAGFDLVV